MRRSPMKQRANPMKRGAFMGRNPGGAEVARTAIGRQITAGQKSRPAAQGKHRRDTGFSPAQKLAIRARAGNGNPDDARCEATGVWLGRYGGEIQHIRARGMGGSHLRNVISNGVLLSREAHRRAEARDPHMRAMGFWLLSGDPPSPVMLHGEQGGVTKWLSDDGRYLPEPEVAA